jgi:hypothetical protein
VACVILHTYNTTIRYLRLIDIYFWVLHLVACIIKDIRSVVPCNSFLWRTALVISLDTDI